MPIASPSRNQPEVLFRFTIMMSRAIASSFQAPCHIRSNKFSSARILATSLCIVLGLNAGCRWEETPPPPPVPDQSADQGEGLTPDLLEIPVERQAAPVRVPDGGASELASFLAVMELRQSQASSQQEYLSFQQVRLEAARRLAEKPNLDEPVRVLAKRTQLDAMLKMHAMQQPGMEERLRETAEQLRDDPQPTVAMSAEVSLMALQLQSYLRGEEEEFEAVLERGRYLTSRYRDQPALASELEAVAATLLGTDRREQARQFLTVLIEGLRPSTDPQVRMYVTRMEDRLRMADAGLDVAINNLRRGRAGAEDDFKQGLQTLLATPQITPEIYQEIQRSLRFLEIIDQYDLARQSHEIVRSVLGQRTDVVANQAEIDAQMASRRLGLLNSPFQLEAYTLDGAPLDWQKYSGKVVLVVYWSATVEASVSALQALDRMQRELGDRTFAILAVSVDNDPAAIRGIFGSRAPSWDIVMQSGGAGDGGIAIRHGIQQFPFLVLVDRQGTVVDINVPLADVQPRVMRMLAQ